MEIGFQTYHPQQPEHTVVARNVDDVVAAVRRAAEEDRPLAVQATGHGVGVVDPRSILVDTSQMTGVDVDPEARTARVEAGARWADVVPLAAAHGLAPLTGSTSNVGVVGYLVGGGLPILGRTFGWAADRVRSFEVVTASGERQTVSDREGLGWALRGGGGSYAVVTAVEVELVELSKVYGGTVFFAGDDPEPLLRAWRDWAVDLPNEVATSVALVTLPDVDALPPPIRGRRVLGVRLTCTELDDGPRRAEEVRGLGGEVLLDGLDELSWVDSDSIHSDPTQPAPSVVTHVLTGGLSDAALAASVEAVRPREGLARRVLEVRRMGGALRRPTGLPIHHDGEWLVEAVSVLSSPEADPGDTLALNETFRSAWADETVGRLTGFLGPEAADPDVARTAFEPGVWERLVAVRDEVDPDRRFLAAVPVG